MRVDIYCKQAKDKLVEEIKSVKGNKETAMAMAASTALSYFCEQSEEFAQAVVQGGNFGDCMKAVAKGVGQFISDIEVYRKAAKFYFATATVELKMTINTEGNTNPESELETVPSEQTSAGNKSAIELSLDDLLDW